MMLIRYGDHLQLDAQRLTVVTKSSQWLIGYFVHRQSLLQIVKGKRSQRPYITCYSLGFVLRISLS